MSIPIVNHSLAYNPALDGLRGIAILLVLLFHIWPVYFSFGYVGVDIFFVLSGYLITQIIHSKLLAKNFSFLEFYRNRVRRIFPAMIIVLLTTFLVGYLFLFPSELAQLGKHMESSAFFYQNFRLIGETGYWDKVAQLKPLLHFWSLSIEEQFYIFWPLFIFLLYKTNKNIFYSLFLICLLLFAIPLFANIDPFYHSFSRFWELALGGVFYSAGKQYEWIVRGAANYKWIVYLFFAIAIGLAINNTAFHPFKTLSVAAATGFMILHFKSHAQNNFFSNPILIFLGLISFPLYLWHYVFVSYMHIFGLDVAKYGIVVIIISILLAYLVYRYIEIYARKQTSYFFAAMLFCIVVLVGILGRYAYLHKGSPARPFLVKHENFERQFIREDATNDRGIKMLSSLLGHKPYNNYIKATSMDLSKPFVAIIGDSHAHTSYPGFAYEFKKRGYESILIGNSSCPPYIGGAMGKNITEVQQCKQKIDDIYRALQKIPMLRKVIFITRGPVYMYDIGYGVVDSGGKPLHYHFEEYFYHQVDYNQKLRFFDAVEQTFKYFSTLKDIHFYYMIENPELGFSPENCMERPLGILPSTCRIAYSKYLKRAGEYREKVYRLIQRYPSVTLLDPKDLYCDGSYCYPVKNGKMLYADDDHQSLDGSMEQAQYFMEHM